MTTDHVARTRSAYGDSAQHFTEAVGTTISPEFEAPVDRALLAAFVDLVPAHSRTVIDAGCGPGRVARFLADRDLDVLGVDIAPGMIDAARRAHPTLRFATSPLTGLPVAAGSGAGVAYWYSIITTPPENLGEIWLELDRVLSPEGVAIAAFQCGNGEADARIGAFGTDTDLTLFHHSVDDVVDTIEETSLSVQSVTRREQWFAHETTDQAFVIVGRPA